MAKIRLDDRDYDVDDLSDRAKKLASEIQKVTQRIQEAQNMTAILTKAKKAYIADLKTEMLSAKAGLLFGDD
jgi:predicted  nucleic acid-binding Zn-ribbon protein